MTLEQIHDIVHGLSSNQRNHFSRFVGKEGKKNKYWVLYQRLKDTKVLTSQVEKRIRGKEFTNTDTFNQYRIILADKIVQSVASQQKEVENSKSYVEAALSLGIFELAKKSLFSQMERAFEKQEYFYLQAHFERLREIRRTYKVDWTVPKGLPTMAEVRKVCSNIGLLEDLTTRVVNGLQNGGGFVVDTADLERVDELELGTDVERYLYMGLKSKMSLQQEDYLGAAAHHEKLVNALISGEIKSPFVVQVRETIFLIRLALITKDDRKALKYNSLLANFSSFGKDDAEYFSSLRVETNISVALNTWNDELILDVYDELKETIDSNNQLRAVYLKYFGSLVLFYNGQYELAKDILTSLRNNYTKNQLDGYFWAVEILFLLCHFELKSSDLIESIIPNCERTFRKRKYGYPLMILQSIKRFNKSPVLLIEDLTEVLRNVEGLRSQEVEISLFNFFDFSFWLKEKLGKGEMVSFAKNQRINKDWKTIQRINQA